MASGRVTLQCSKSAGHDGLHHDAEQDEEWEDRGDELTHLLRMTPDEDE